MTYINIVRAAALGARGFRPEQLHHLRMKCLTHAVVKINRSPLWHVLYKYHGYFSLLTLYKETAGSFRIVSHRAACLKFNNP